MISWDNLVASQPQAVGLLRAAIDGGRLHHAYALVGQERRVALRLAQATAAALVCSDRRIRGNGGDGGACGECAPCRKIDSGNHPDVMTLAPNEKDLIPIGPVREVAARLALRATEAPTKVVIIERADRMNPAAQNALLKTLEEPPGPTCFLLTVERFRALLPTVRSRCQRIRLAPPDRGQAVDRLVAAGLEPAIAKLLAVLIGSDHERGLEIIDAGGEEVLAALRRALAPGASTTTVLDVAAELGSDANRTRLALAFVEVILRDRLAARHGAAETLLYGGPVDQRLHPPKSATRIDLAGAVDRIARLRLLHRINLNRTLSLEGLLLQLSGHLRGPASGAAPSAAPRL